MSMTRMLPDSLSLFSSVQIVNALLSWNSSQSPIAIHASMVFNGSHSRCILPPYIEMAVAIPLQYSTYRVLSPNPVMFPNRLIVLLGCDREQSGMHRKRMALTYTVRPATNLASMEGN